MHSIGRETEFERANARIDALKKGINSKVHFAVVAPQHGGLSLFLNDLAEKRREANDIVLYSKITDSLSTETAFATLASELAIAVGDIASDGNIETLLRLGRKLRDKNPQKIAVIILDVAPALRGILENPQLRRSAKSNPLLQKLRTLVNLLQNHEPPIAIVVGWDDRFRSYARDWGVGDTVQRYAVEMLFADYGLGRAAWPLYRAIFKAGGLEVSGEYPGICGSKLPAGAFVAEAKRLNRTVINGEFLLTVLSDRIPAADRDQLNNINKSILERLCLSDEVLELDPQIGALAQPTENGGYVASRELYNLLDLTPPREIVSFEERVRLRLEDNDADLPTEAANGVALILAVDDPSLRANGGITFKLKKEFVPEPFHELEILLLWSFAVVPDPGLVQAAVAWIEECEKKPELGIQRLLILLHRDPALRNGFRRGVNTALGELGISDPRPHGVKASGRETQARFLAGLLTVELEVRQIIDAVWRNRDSAHSGELVQLFLHEIRGHYATIARHMPRLSSDAISAEALQKLIHGCGGPIEIGPTVGDRLRRLGIATSEEGNRYIWRWRNDRLLQWLASFDNVDIGTAANDYLFDPSEWLQIASAIQAAYGDSLIQRSENILTAVDPLPLLQSQYTEARAQLMTACDSFLEIASLDRQEFWRARINAISEESPENVGLCEDAIDEIWRIYAELEDERKIAIDVHQRTQEDLKDLRKKLDAVAVPTNVIAQEKKKFEKVVDSAIDQNLGTPKILDQGRKLLESIEQSVGQTKVREERASPLRQEAEQLAAKGPEFKASAETILREIEDPNIPPEQIASELEKLKIRSERTTVPDAQDAAIKSLARETFQNNDEDLARLATIYGHANIVTVDVE